MEVDGAVPFVLSVTVGFGNVCMASRAGREENQGVSVNDVLKERMAEEDKKAADDSRSADTGNKESSTGKRQTGLNNGAPAPEPLADEKISDGAAEIDLTTHSGIMVYSEVYNCICTIRQLWKHDCSYGIGIVIKASSGAFSIHPQ